MTCRWWRWREANLLTLRCGGQPWLWRRLLLVFFSLYIPFLMLNKTSQALCRSMAITSYYFFCMLQLAQKSRAWFPALFIYARQARSCFLVCQLNAGKEKVWLPERKTERLSQCPSSYSPYSASIWTSACWLWRSKVCRRSHASYWRSFWSTHMSCRISLSMVVGMLQYMRALIMSE